MTTPFQILQDDWVLIAPLGDHDHPLGVQRITETSNAKMANAFNSLLGKLGRLFVGAPTFEGHHDVEPDRYPNSRSYGWITQLENRGPNGLWGRMNWTPEGRAFLQNGAFKFVSPLFSGQPIAHQNGRTIYEPIRFKSLALTNEPNLPLPPLANTKDNMETITEILGLQAEATPDQIIEATRDLKFLANRQPGSAPASGAAAGASPDASPSSEASAKEDSLDQLTDRLATLQNELATRDSSLETARAERDAERAARIDLILANAIEKGRITKADEQLWRDQLTADIDAAQAKLANAKTTLPTESQTKHLGNQRGQFDTAAARATFINQYMSAKTGAGLSYDEAWTQMRREHPNLFPGKN